ncbi:Putative epoxide hydrolase [Cytospora mali]|uniref:Epoxide hydrolase n=1 Tax=Cytospora mali TaxID=578113 RepID=A0A194UYM0_CYTMA|nr:Putative epoxide hydrolase [Valsa mali var. pyri (nom. inval.)]
MAEIESPGAGLAAGDEVKPYKVHVSSRYLDLTRQKLELTRLPHEGAKPPSEEWWEPKPQVEPLIDFWLEKYSWRTQEEALNKTPQFRTAISVSASETPLRIHFIHVASPHSHALPLLLIPPFPFSNLALTHLVKPFTDPEDASSNQPFHLVIPALPGLGFSDAFPNNTPVISTTADMLNTLMSRLGYQHYLVTNSGAAQSSPAEIDWKLLECLSNSYPNSCVGAHFVSPPLASPRLSEAPLEWAKWTIANVFNAPILGYKEEDFSALKHAGAFIKPRSSKKTLNPAKLGLNNVGLREPNTLAYAMCDSPTGILVFVMKGLRLLAPRMKPTPEQVITITNLAWLPGPEYAMRFWAHCAQHDETKGKSSKKKAATRPRVGITVFLGDKEEEGSDSVAREAGEDAIQLEGPTNLENGTRYACPGWAKARYSVLSSQRVSGEAGLLAWERPDVILTGIRGLAKEVTKVDRRLKPSSEPTTSPLEAVVTPKETTSKDGGLKPPERPALEQGDSSRTQVGSQPPSSPKRKESEPVSAKPAVSPLSKDDNDDRKYGEGKTSDTVVLVTPPKDNAAK